MIFNPGFIEKDTIFKITNLLIKLRDYKSRRADSSNEIKISPIIAGYENYYVKYQPLQIEKINVDKVGD